MRQLTLIAAFAVMIALPVRPATQIPSRFTELLLGTIAYRNLGPFRAGSWLTDIAVPDSPLHEHLYTFYIATRNGGVWKTINNGTTFEPIFDKQDVSSIGAVAVAPSASNIVWVGTGEAYQARSSNSGNGVYKSTDAGRTWAHMGLPDSHHIAKTSFTQPAPTSSTSRPWDTCGRATKSVDCSKRPTVAARGTRCCT
jgi:hypothetical protein